jgi:hypothetical protein
MDDRDESGWSRSEWARWFLDHDEVDEAARTLEVGDVLELGDADRRDLAAALGRRGLAAECFGRELFVRAGDEGGARSERRPPARVEPRISQLNKKSA